MQLGDRGEQVRGVQTALKATGYQVDVDGIFGPQTDKAVRLFQHDRSLTVDGIVGPQTLNRLAFQGSAATPALPVLRSVNQSVSLALYWSTQKAKYILGEGGRNPANLMPMTPDNAGALGSDCVGFVLWCLGIDRYQPKLFTYYDGWMNTDSIIDDAKTRVGGGLWKILPKPEAGCLVIFPSLRDGNGKMTRMGHVAIVTEIPAIWPDDVPKWPSKTRTELLKLVKVVDCNASLSRRFSGRAIGPNTAAALWDKPDAVFVGWVGERAI